MTVIKSLNRAIREKKTKKVLTYFRILCREHFGYEAIENSRCGVSITRGGLALIDLIVTNNTPTGLLNQIHPISRVQFPIQKRFMGYTCDHHADTSLEDGIICSIGHNEQLSKADEVKFAGYGRWVGEKVYFKESCRLSLKIPQKEIGEITLEDIKEEF